MHQRGRETLRDGGTARYVHTAATSHLHSYTAFELARRRRASAVARQDADRVAAQTRQCAAPCVRDGMDWDGRALLGRGEDKERRRQTGRRTAVSVAGRPAVSARAAARATPRLHEGGSAAHGFACFTRAGGRAASAEPSAHSASAHAARKAVPRAAGLSAPIHCCQTWEVNRLKRTAFGHGLRQRAAAVLMGCARQGCSARCRLRRRTFGARFGQRVRQQQHVAHIGRHLARNRRRTNERGPPDSTQRGRTQRTAPKSPHRPGHRMGSPHTATPCRVWCSDPDGPQYPEYRIPYRFVLSPPRVPTASRYSTAR